MKMLAIFLALSLSVPAYGAPEPFQVQASTSYPSLEPVIITAPAIRERRKVIQRLKTARAVGGVTALSGAGLMVSVAVFAGGPVGWAAGLIFFGGMTAYLSHRRLEGHKDFGPMEPDLPPAERTVKK